MPKDRRGAASLMDAGISRENPLEQIWNGPKMSEMLNYSREKIEGPCRTCDNFDYCHGACRGATFAHTGDLNSSFPVCLYRAALERKALE